MAACLNCDAEIKPGVVEIGDPVICDKCGAEHEVINEVPLELDLVDDEDLDAGSRAADDDDDSEDEEDD